MLGELIRNRNIFLKKKNILEADLKKTICELTDIENQIRKLCVHDWSCDYIDAKYGEGSIKIEYCEICELSK
tara:strand:- start:2830 stop:3045 length:216 start_codon:yes stop_codon:yes gene_type:complete